MKKIIACCVCCFVSLYVSATAQVIGILNEPGIADAKDNAPAHPERLQTLFQSHGWTANLFAAAELSDSSKLNRNQMDVLLLPYGARFPQEASDSFRAYVRGGGKFITLGGYAFKELMAQSGQTWSPVDLSAVKQKTSAFWQFRAPRAAFEGGHRVALTVYARAVNVQGTFGYISLYQTRADGSMATFNDKLQLKGDMDWKAYAFEDEAHPDAAFLDFKLGLYEASGQVLFDDIRITIDGNVLLSDPIDGAVDASGQPLNWKPEGSVEACTVARQNERGLVLQVAHDADALRRLDSCEPPEPGGGIFLKPWRFPVFDLEYPFEHVAQLKGEANGCVFSPDIALSLPIEGWAAVGAVVERGRWRPLMTAYDRYGEARGPVMALMHVIPQHAPPVEWVHGQLSDYNGASWGFCGVTNRDLFDGALPEMDAGLVRMAELLRQDCYLFQPDSSLEVYRPGETVELSVAACNGGRQSFAGEVALVVDNATGGSEIVSTTQAVSAAPNEMPRVVFTLEGISLTPGIYLAHLALRQNDDVVDHMEYSFRVAKIEDKQRGPVLRYENNYYHVNGRARFISGCDDWGNGCSQDARTTARHAQMRRDHGIDLYETLASTTGEFDEAALRRQEKVLLAQQDARQIYMMGSFISMNVAADAEALKAQAVHAGQIAQYFGSSPNWMHYLNGDLRVILDPSLKTLWNEYLRECYGTDEALRDAWGAQTVSSTLGDIPIADLSQNGLGWSDMRTFDANAFRAWLIRRWSGALGKASKAQAPNSPVILEFYEFPYEGVDIPCGTEQVDISNIGFFGKTRDFPKTLACTDQRSRGKSFGVGEFGAISHPLMECKPTELAIGSAWDKQRHHFASVFLSTLGMGGSHVQMWCWMNGDYYYFPWGYLHTADDAPKDILRFMRGLNLFMRQIPVGYTPPKVGFITADRFRLSGSQEAHATHYAVRDELGFALGAQPGELLTLNECDLRIPEGMQLILYPLAYFPPDEVYDELKGFVEKGGALYVSGDVAWGRSHKRTKAERLEALCGVRFLQQVAEPFSTGNAPEVSYAALAEPSFFMTGAPPMRVEPAGAEVLMQTEKGEAIVTRFRLGKGQVIFSSDPMGIHSDGKFEQNAQFYRHVMSWAGIEPVQITPYIPSVQVFRLPLADGGRLYVINNMANGAGAASFSITEAPRPITLVVKPECVGVAWFGPDGALLGVGAQGPVSLDGKPLFVQTPEAYYLSGDGRSLEASTRLIAMPMEPGKIEYVPAHPWKMPQAEAGTVSQDAWRAYEAIPATQQPSIQFEVDTLQALNLVALSEQAELPQLREDISRMIAGVDKP